MKKLLLLALPLLAITFNSCSKDDEGGSGNDSGKLVKSISYDHGDGSGPSFTEIEYDNQQRPIKVNAFTDHRTISYGNNSVTIHYTEADGVLTLDNNGYVEYELYPPIDYFCVRLFEIRKQSAIL